MKLTRMAASLLFASIVPGTPACRAGQAHRDAQRSVFDRLCDGTRPCEEIYVWGLNQESSHALVEFKDCVEHQKVTLSGFAFIGHAASRRFKWRAAVREHAVFPTLDDLDAFTGCHQAHPDFYSPAVSLVGVSDLVDWARLEGDDVFIPFDGTAAIDHAFYATAVLDAPDGGASRRVAISVAEPPLVQPKLQGHLGPGDSFVWGDHRATVVRIVEPQDGDLGVIGWVEIKLSEGAPPGRGS
jgi:hypothetical protein